jgi:hypothetical protein
MSRKYQYRDLNQPGFLSDLNQEFEELTRVVEQGKVTRERKTITVHTNETQLKHTLGAEPKMVRFFPRGDARVWMVKKTNTTVFLQASAKVIVDVEIEV